MTSTTATTQPPLAAEATPSAAVYLIPDQQPRFTPTPHDPSNTSPLEKIETLPPAAPILPPLFINSVAELKHLSAAIASVQKCYEDLYDELDSLKAIVSSNSPGSELEGLCKTMSNRGIRKYLQTHLSNSNLPQLRQEVSEALKLAPNPSRLVFESLGKFYFPRNGLIAVHPTMARAREVSNFILECFLLMMRMGGKKFFDKAIKMESRRAALVWRNRLLSEGGFDKADQTDVRGLLLFVSCFGFPNSFLRGDIRELLCAANAREIVGVLRLSRLLMYKITDIVVGMLKHKMEVDAVDLVYTFGLEERFSPHDILASHLLESKESWKIPQKGPQSSLPATIEAKKKQLATLISIHRCLKRHEIDPAKLLPEWEINEQIAILEKDVNADRELGEITPIKRKSSETVSPRKLYTREPKRACFISHGPRQLKTKDHVDRRTNFLRRGSTTRHPNNYRKSTPVVNRVHGEEMVGTSGPVKKQASNSCVRNNIAGRSSPVIVGHTKSVEGFGGVTNASSVGLSSRDSDHYQFDDTVGESELYPSVAAGPAHHSPDLYEG